MRSRLAWKTRFLLAQLKDMPGPETARDRVLCLLRGGLGDKLMALPALRQFRREFAGSEMTLFVEGVCPPFFELEADRLCNVPASAPWRKAVAAMRGFDACFVNSIGVFDIWSEIAAFISQARDRRGPRVVDHSDADTVYTRPFVFGGAHETLINFQGAGGVSAESALPYPLRIPGRERPEEATPSIILHPGSSALGNVNRWSRSNFAALGRMLSEEGFGVTAVGTSGESDLLQTIQQESGGVVEPVIRLPLSELAHVLAGASVVIANDSGIGHLAAAVGAPLISLMGATRPANVGPVGLNVTILGTRCPRNGCYGELPPEECLRCVNLIGPEEVFACAMKVAGETKQAEPLPCRISSN